MGETLYLRDNYTSRNLTCKFLPPGFFYIWIVLNKIRVFIKNKRLILFVVQNISNGHKTIIGWEWPTNFLEVFTMVSHGGGVNLYSIKSIYYVINIPQNEDLLKYLGFYSLCCYCQRMLEFTGDVSIQVFFCKLIIANMLHTHANTTDVKKTCSCF